MKKQDLINKILPPSTRECREDFDSKKAIDSLTLSQKYFIEDELILLLENRGNYIDDLIITSLVHLKSKKSIPTLLRIINDATTRKTDVIHIAISVFSIDNFYEEMKSKALDAFNTLSNPYEMGVAFYRLSIFNDPKIDKIIEAYINDKDRILSYFAKNALSRKMRVW